MSAYLCVAALMLLGCVELILRGLITLVLMLAPLAFGGTDFLHPVCFKLATRIVEKS